MQVLSTYLLESPDLSSTQLAARLAAVRVAISTWLSDKGATDADARSGSFESLTQDGNGSFTREEYVVPVGTLQDVRLEEFTRSGQIFTTRLAAVSLSGRLRVYCTLTVVNAASVVAPLPIDPRCPAIIRALLAQSADWSLSGTPIAEAKPQILTGKVGGRTLADEIRLLDRSLPIIAVSEIEGEQLWPKLADNLAFDLAALAKVVTIDDEATWELSDQVGKLHSCYRGAVRLYWPPRKRADGTTHFNSTVWTASVLVSSDKDGKGVSRFRSTLRHLLMSTAALSITPPHAIREIQDAVVRRQIEDLEARSTPDSEELAIARLYIKENQDLKTRLEQLQDDLARTAARASAAEHALSQLKAPDLIEEEESASEASPSEPAPGDVCFYKKIHSKSAYDVFVQVDDCGHTSWQGSAKADKARKGLERLTSRSDWKSLQHCGTCTGGGMWKVRW
jgi:hypothetical protein